MHDVSHTLQSSLEGCLQNKVSFQLFSIILNIVRKFLKKKKNLSNIRTRVLPDTEKLEFVRKSVSWIEGRDILDTCFVLNFGYEAPLPWVQV